MGITPIGGSRSIGEILETCRRLVEPALRDAVDRLSPPVRLMAGYHLGWWEADGTVVDVFGGKGIRPALTVLCAEAVGGQASLAVPAAAAVELAHNFSLLHDDVMDRDEHRRHRLTAWRVFGVGGAILAGDALLTLSFEQLNAKAGEAGVSPGAAGSALIRTLSGGIQAMIDGQIADVSFERRSDVALAECVQMSRNKTGALLGAACRLGALAGGGSPDQVDALTTFGAELGLAFQVNDDLMGIWGDPQVTGKADYSDLRNRKKSLPVVAALESNTAAGRELRVWFASTSEPTADDVVRVAGLIEEGGGREWARQQLVGLHSDAIAQLARARPAVDAATALSNLSALVTALGRR